MNIRRSFWYSTGIMHKSLSHLSQELQEAAGKVAVGSRYIHYKNPTQYYRVIALGTLEASEETCVIYKAEYGDNLIFVRPLSSWLQQVEIEGTPINRFTKVD